MFGSEGLVRRSSMEAIIGDLIGLVVVLDGRRFHLRWVVGVWCLVPGLGVK